MPSAAPAFRQFHDILEVAEMVGVENQPEAGWLTASSNAQRLVEVGEKGPLGGEPAFIGSMARLTRRSAAGQHSRSASRTRRRA